MFFTKKNIIKYHLPLFTLGFTTNIVQVILFREIINTFYNNELVIGIILAFWMLLTGLGAWIGRKKQTYSEKWFFTWFVVFGILPVILVFLISLYKHFFFLPGEIISIWKLIPFIIFLLLPFCILSGRIFNLISTNYNSEEKNSGKLYSVESAGSILGGLVVGLIMVLWLSTLQALAINCYLVLVAAIYCYLRANSFVKILVSVFILIIPLLFFIKDYDLALKQLILNEQVVLKTKETPYGNLTFTSISGQTNVFENLELQFFSENTVSTEEAAHFSMLQRIAPSKILLIGGGISGIAKQVLKYSSVSSVTYVESNPWLLKYSLKYFPLPNDRRLKTVSRDGRSFVKHDTSKYDIIIVSVASPTSLQLNRYYTVEFFNEIKKRCNKGAVVSISIASSENYMSVENRLLHSVLYKTLKSEFDNLVIIPGEKDYFLASDDSISIEIARLYDQNTIKNDYVNSGFIDDRSLAERSNSILKVVKADVPVNKDYKPVAAYIETSLFFNRFGVNTIFLIIVVVIILLLPLFHLKINAISMYITGFTASALEIIILMLFQIIFGYLYAAAGVLFAVFMAGLAFGSWKSNFNTRNVSLVLQMLLAIAVIIIPFLIVIVNKINIDAITYPLFFVCIFAVATITGMQFANQVKQMNISDAAGYTYGVDLVGSALGALLISVVLLPVFGLFQTIVILVILNVFAIAVLLSVKSKIQ